MDEAAKALIYTSYYSRLRRIDGSVYYPIAISAYVPKFFSGLSFLMLAPSRELVLAYKNAVGMTEEKFTALYTADRLWTHTPSEIVDRIFGAVPNGMTPVLLCYEKSGDFCHRHILARWLTEGGYPCQELHEELLLPKGCGA